MITKIVQPRMRYYFGSLSNSFKKSKPTIPSNFQQQRILAFNSDAEYIESERLKYVNEKLQNFDVSSYIGFGVNKVCYRHFYFENSEVVNVNLRQYLYELSARPEGADWSQENILKNQSVQIDIILDKMKILVNNMYSYEAQRGKEFLQDFLKSKAEKRGKIYSYEQELERISTLDEETFRKEYLQA